MAMRRRASGTRPTGEESCAEHNSAIRPGRRAAPFKSLIKCLIDGLAGLYSEGGHSNRPANANFLTARVVRSPFPTFNLYYPI